MIFRNALRRELASLSGAVITTLFTITITVMLIRILGQAASGQIASADVAWLLFFTALNYLPIILILTGFISVLLAVTRAYQDSEMIVWFVSGSNLLHWIRPTLSFGWQIIVLTGLLSFVVTPWANQQSTEIRERFIKREDIAKVSPGKFIESASGHRIFFVEGTANHLSQVHNVFIHTAEPNLEHIVTAQSGTIEQDAQGTSTLTLQKGRRYDVLANEAGFRLMQFERYGLSLPVPATTLNQERATRALSTRTLIQEPSANNLAELLWRAALPLMALCLMLLAIPLGFVNPRAGRSINLMIALLLFVTYSNMTGVFETLVAQQKLSFHLAWWPIHIFVLSLTTCLFLWRMHINSRFHPQILWSAFKRFLCLKRNQAQ